MDTKKLVEEQEYLDKTIKIIKKELEQQEEKCENGIENVRDLSKYHWERQSEMDEIEFATSRSTINSSAVITNEALSRLRKLRKSLQNPFFGKIKVDFDGEEEPFYIGLTSIMDNNDLVINDWRSPIANLFYNSKLGNTSYKTPNGIVDCNLLQREQIKIKNEKVTRIIDSDIHLSDEELQEVLNKSSDNKMKSIITTIQEEQNEIIRNLTDKKIIVQGCAGSGKTSVALHRLSYLLYNDKKINEDNMLIFSPSNTFSSYISNVLPDLGDNNVLETTFSDFANAFIKRFDKIESFMEFISKYYNNENSEEKNKLNEFKFSKEYKEALDLFIQKQVNNYRFLEDVSVNGITIPNEYLNNIVNSFDNISMQEKIDILTDAVCNLFIKKLNVNKKTVRSTIARDLIKPAFDARSVYNKFLQSDEFAKYYGSISDKLNKNILEYPDLIGMLYINFEIMGYPKNNLIHHLVIDEVQDYTPLQLEMINKMFANASITVLGDKAQSLNPYYKYDSLEEMKKIFGVGSKYFELNKAYRSSKEIMEYVKKILNDLKIEIVRKSMDEPVKIKEVDKNYLFNTLVTDILELKKENKDRICIITKNQKEALAIHEGLKDNFDITVLNENSDVDKNIYVSPSYNAKGLEFDAVICYNNINDSYNEEDKYLYYVAVTRAQHNLLIYNEPKTLKKEV